MDSCAVVRGVVCKMPLDVSATLLALKDDDDVRKLEAARALARAPRFRRREIEKVGF